jgi:hypothetical protein
VTYGVLAMPVVPMFTREPRRGRLATAPTVGHARLGRAIHAARPHAVDVELDSDQRLMVLLLGRRGAGPLRPAVIRGSWWWWCSDRVDAVEGDPPQPDV